MIIKNSNFGRGLQHTKAKIYGQKMTVKTQDAVVHILTQSQHNAPNTYGFDMRRFPSDRLENCPIESFIVRANNEPVAFVDICDCRSLPDKRNFAEVFIVVSPQYYGRGIGQSLLDASIDWLNNQDYYDGIRYPILADVVPLKKLLDSSQFKLDKSETAQRDGATYLVYKYIR